MQVTRLILGTVQLGMNYGINNSTGQPSKDQAFEILSYAYSSGIRALDTAYAYGNSHEVIEKYFKTHPHESFKIFTKFQGKEGLQLANYIEKTSNQLEENIYCCSYHSFSELNNLQISSQLKKLKAEGKIKKIGVSVYTNDEIREAAKYDFIDIIQLPFNLLDNWGRRGQEITFAKEHGKTIHIRSIFLQGLFYMDPSSLTENLKSMSSPISALKKIARDTHLNLNQLAIRYALSFKDIDQILIGVETLKQLKDNIEATTELLPDEIIKKISLIEVPEPKLLDPRNWK